MSIIGSKKGQEVVLNSNITNSGDILIPKLTTGILLKDVNHIDDFPYVQFNVDFNKNLHDSFGFGGEEGKCYAVHVELLDFPPKYESSNRFKLKQAIIDTGYSSRRLSHIAVGNESFFYNQTGKARFKEKGDISNELLEKLKVMVAKAQEDLTNKLTDSLIEERVENDIAPKTVDENNVPVVEQHQNTKGEEVSYPDQKAHDMSNWVEIRGADQEAHDSYIDQLQAQAIEKRDYRLRNFMIAFLILVVILAAYFFAK